MAILNEKTDASEQRELREEYAFEVERNDLGNEYHRQMNRAFGLARKVLWEVEAALLEGLCSQHLLFQRLVLLDSWVHLSR